MNLENNPTKIIVYAIALSWFIAKFLLPRIIQWRIKYLQSYYRRLYELGTINEFSALNARCMKIRERKYKPFSCLGCMSFWLSIIFSLISGLQAEAGIVGIVGFAFGCMLEGILMRYF